MKLTDFQMRNRAAQKRHITIKKLPSVPKEPSGKGIDAFLLPDAGRNRTEQHVTQEWNRQQIAVLERKASNYEGEALVWALNMIAELQAMWIEATDERDELRKELELREWAE